jgi:inosose dehydratase
MKIAGAPISWGVCEVPGWGPMLPVDRVLRELKSLDLHALELGAPGFLPETGPKVHELLQAANVEMLGGFVPVIVHDAAQREATLASARTWAELLSVSSGGRGGKFVSAIVVDADWSPRRPLESAEWTHMFSMFEAIDGICAEFGLEQVLHPHVGTLVETRADVQRVLDNSNIGWCLDTGHLAIGGFDPLDFAKLYADRTKHVHLKDVNLATAELLNGGELSLMAAVFAGLFRSLGEGDVDIAGVLQTLAAANYDGWYVLEQDISIDGEAPPEGTGPVEDIAVSLAFVRKHLALAGQN